MKLKYSLFTRRQFLNGLLGGWAAALMASLVYPVIAFIFPPYKEPDEVILSIADFQDMAPGEARTFAWGNKPGILKKNEDGSLTIYIQNLSTSFNLISGNSQCIFITIFLYQI